MRGLVLDGEGLAAELALDVRSVEMRSQVYHGPELLAALRTSEHLFLVNQVQVKQSKYVL